MERTRLQADKSPPGVTAFVLAFVLGMAACGGPQPASNATPGISGQPDYPPPPELTGVSRAPGGALSFTGVAAPGAAVRLATPTGLAGVANADARGNWKVLAPPAGAPGLFSLSTVDGGRVTQAMGYLFVAPGGVAARLRAGGGSEALAAGAQGLAVQTLDYDDKGAATLAGVASPGEAVSLRVDGVERGESAAGGDGRFVVALNTPLTSGNHEFDLASPSGEVRTQIVVSGPPRLTGLFAARPIAGGWRIDWLTPGGGEQTTLLLANGAASR